MSYLNLDHAKPLDIVFLGRVTIDLNPAYDDVVREEFKPLKEVHYFEKFVGGSTANVAIGAARHGLKVGFIGKISDDSFGEYVVEFLSENRVDTKYVTKCQNGEKLGLTFTEMLSPTESSILMYRNKIADLQLDVKDIDEDYIKSARSVFVSGTALAESPSREAVLKMVLLARRNGTNIIFDIDHRNYNWKNMDELSIYYSIVAKASDVIIGSREEFDLTERLIKTEMSDEESAAFWHSCGVKIVIIKHGTKGSNAYTSDGRKYEVKPFPVAARKGFGGGDGYAAGFLYGLYQGWDIGACLEFGSAEASMMVRSNSCADSLPNTDMVAAFIETEKKLYGEMVDKKEPVEKL